MKHRINRRDFLATVVAGTSTALVGCIGGTNTNTDLPVEPSEPAQSVIDEIGIPSDTLHSSSEHLYADLVFNDPFTTNPTLNSFSWVDVQILKDTDEINLTGPSDLLNEDLVPLSTVDSVIRQSTSARILTGDFGIDDVPQTGTSTLENEGPSGDMYSWEHPDYENSETLYVTNNGSVLHFLREVPIDDVTPLAEAFTTQESRLASDEREEVQTILSIISNQAHQFTVEIYDDEHANREHRGEWGFVDVLSINHDESGEPKSRYEVNIHFLENDEDVENLVDDYLERFPDGGFEHAFAGVDDNKLIVAQELPLDG